MSFRVPNHLRITTGRLASTPALGNNGAFRLTFPPSMRVMMLIASEGLGWEHVSASFADRCPTWSEMCRVKDLFWDEEDEVIQIHPRKSEYVNAHPFCLHLWRPIGVELPMPPSLMVG